MTPTCDHPLRDGPCQMDSGHRGRHSTVAFYCDGCGKTRRGTPHAADADVALCFMCLRDVDGDIARAQDEAWEAELAAIRDEEQMVLDGGHA